MNDWDREPWQDQVNKIKCKFCGEDSDYDFVMQVVVELTGKKWNKI
jgi:hypothetical protein